MAYSIHTKERLPDKVDSAWHRISNHRGARERIWKSYIGDNYGLSAPGAERIPLNGHALYARSLIQYLAAFQPKILISTDVGPWKAHMESVEYESTSTMKEERFGFKQQRWVLDALVYSPGIMKICREWRRVPQGDEGDYAEALKVYVSNVDGSDAVWDTSASSWWDAPFVGHKIYPYVEDVIGNPMFRHVDPDELRGMSGWGVSGNERLFFENDDQSRPYREVIPMFEIYDRCENRLKIWPIERSNLELYNEKWEGHVNGPLHVLDFLDVPNHVIGLSPLCILHNLIEATNRALSKTIKQTDAAKTIMRIVGGNRAEAEAVMEALDGTGVYQDGGGVAEMMSVGGPDQRTMMMVPVLRDMYNWLGGDITQLGRSIAGAPTATQGQGIQQAVSGMIEFMEARKNDAVRGAVEALVQYQLQDDVTTGYMPKALPDGQTYWKTLTPEQRTQIDSILLNIDIDVFSMRYKSPEQRLATVMQWWQGVALPGYQIWQAQGGEYDMQALNRAYAKMTDEPIINDIALYSMKPQPEATGSSGAISEARQSPMTTRTSIRMDRGGPSTELGGDLAGQLASMEAA